MVRLALQGALTLLYDDRILFEYREVLLRPKFGFDPDDVSAFVAGLEWSGAAVFASPLAVALPDPDDLPFLEVAAAGGADALVTGNGLHYRPVRGTHDVPVLSPRELLSAVAGRRGPG